MSYSHLFQTEQIDIKQLQGEAQPSQQLSHIRVQSTSFCLLCPLICLSVSVMFFIFFTLTIWIFRSLTPFCVSLHFPLHYLTLSLLSFFPLSFHIKGKPSDLLISFPSWHTDSEEDQMISSTLSGVLLRYLEHTFILGRVMIWVLAHSWVKICFISGLYWIFWVVLHQDVVVLQLILWLSKWSF